MEPITEKGLLSLMQNGPTLPELTEIVNRQRQDKLAPRKIGEVLVTLQNEGYVFLDKGRWWRTPEGISRAEKIVVGGASSEEEPQTLGTRPHFLSFRAITISRDLVVACILAIVVLAAKLYYSYGYLIPTWDGAIYLLNARRFLYGYDPTAFFELLRPPFLPYLISLLWSISGESYTAAVPIQPVFTVAASLFLYLIVRHMFDWRTAMLSLFIFLLTPEIFVSTNMLLTHGVHLLFTLLCILVAWKTRSQSDDCQGLKLIACAGLTGISAALASLTRYPAILFFPAVLILVLRRDIVWNLKWLTISAASFIATWTPWLLWNTMYAAGDPLASVKAAFTIGAYVGEIQPWYYYLPVTVGLVTVPGMALLLAGLLKRDTFTDRRHLMFLSWFVVALIASSLLPNKQLRFMVEWFPATAVLITLGIRRIQKTLKFKRKATFNALLGVWLSYLAGSSILLAAASLDNLNRSEARELPVVASWAIANMAKDEVGVSDTYAPQLNYLSRRFFYTLQYLETESNTKKVPMSQLMDNLNVSHVIVTSSTAQARNLNRTDYLVPVEKFQSFVAYEVMNGVGSKHLGILLVGSRTVPDSRLLESRLAFQETARNLFPQFDMIDSNSFFTRLEDAYAWDGRPKYGLIVLLDDVWSDTLQSLTLTDAQLSVLRKLVEEHGVSLMTSGKSTLGWLTNTYGITSRGSQPFTGFQIIASNTIPDWQNLFGNERTWNISIPADYLVFSNLPTKLETLVQTYGSSPQGQLLTVGHQGKGKVAHFSCTAPDLSFNPQMRTVNPILIRALVWLLGDYPRIAKGARFRVALRIDDAQTILYNSIERHASVLFHERGVPLSLCVIMKDLTNTTANLLLRLKEEGCELVLHGATGHEDLVTLSNQTQSLLEGREAFKKRFGLYPTILVPPCLSYNAQTIQAAQRLGFKAISGSTIQAKPPGTRGNHFGYLYSDSTVTMLPVLPLLDDGPFAGWSPSQEIAIARTKWLLASQKWLLGSSIITLHFNDNRLPEIARLVDWVKSIGGEFSTMEQMAEDTFMSPTLELGSLNADSPSFSDFDMMENGCMISFTLNHPVRLRIHVGRDIQYAKVNGKVYKTTGNIVVTGILEPGKRHILLIQVRSESLSQPHPTTASGPEISANSPRPP